MGSLSAIKLILAVAVVCFGAVLGLPRNCYEKKGSRNLPSRVYTIYPYKCCPKYKVRVYCDMETDGGGWTVIQRRKDITPRENFYRTWMEYAVGFGDLTGEFWLGLDHIHAVTDQGLNEIRFDLSDFEGNTSYAKYDFFYVHPRNEYYQLEVNGYTGTAGDSFTYHHNMNFSAKNADYDQRTGSSCSETAQGAWWYNDCRYSNLNGLYHAGNHTSYADGVNWYTWRGRYYSLNMTEMKIRPSAS